MYIQNSFHSQIKHMTFIIERKQMEIVMMMTDDSLTKFLQ